MSRYNHNYLLAFYGDDFTGSTDALEFMSRSGAKTILLLRPPTKEDLAKYKGYDAIGIAGATRSMSPAEMEKELRPAFTALKELGAAHIHYKVCSTFDSSPTIGSIGKAIDVGAEVFQTSFVPLLVAAPLLGRYCVFGNLFARMGIGSQGTIHRLDRHPSMCQHPITPAKESDLRLHLSLQTSKKIGLMDILQVQLKGIAAKKSMEAIKEQGAEVVLIDALYPEQMEGIGKLMDRYASAEEPLFSVGSSGVEMALGTHWIEEGVLTPRKEWAHPGKAEPLLVVSGSCSPITDAQIALAVKKGFAEVALDTEGIAMHGCTDETVNGYASRIESLLQEGRSVILHTSRGTQDERVLKTSALMAARNNGSSNANRSTAQLYGSALGNIVRNVAAQYPIKRVVLVGGDTSSFAARSMGIEAVEMIAPLSPGAPLCRAFAPGTAVDGIEIIFKGGQVGTEDYFGLVLEGEGAKLGAFDFSQLGEKVL